MKKQEKFLNVGGLHVGINDVMVVNKFQEKMGRKNRKNLTTSLRWDVVKIGKNSMTLQVWPTNEIIKIKVQK